MTFNDSVRIRLSFGLLAAAIVQAVVFGAFVYLAQVSPATVEPGLDLRRPADDRGQIGYYESLRPGSLQPGLPLQEPPHVNLAAQGEMKQAGPCLPCNQRPAVTQQPHGIRLNPGERFVGFGPSHTVTTPAATPEAVFTEPVHRVANPVMAPRPQSAAKQTQIALFVDSSAQAQQLRSWFDSDPNLRRMRDIADFQVYRPSDALYKARYASVVPPDQFPAFLFLDADGGHIHAAGRSTIPATPGQLFADCREGWQLYRQAKQGTIQATGVREAGAMKTRGYSWDDAINPAMRLEMNDCVDGNCDPPADRGWRPGSKLDEFFNRDGPVNRTLFLWANANEIGTGILMLIGGGLLIYILARSRR